MNFFRFLFSKRFLKHLAAALVITFLIITGVMLSLRIYTKHGDYLYVPYLKGKTLEQIAVNPEYKDFVFVVLDSVFEPQVPRGTIINQDPFPQSKVKQGRKIYLSVVSSIPEKTKMPDLKFLTLRQAVSVLESCGLKLGRLNYIQTFDEDAVQQQYSDGKVIVPGTSINKGTVISLMVGMGSKGQEILTGPKSDSTVADTM